MQVSNIRGDSKLFFVSFVKPYKSVTAQNFARWVKEILTTAGIDPVIWLPHSVCAASSAHHAAKNLDLAQICKLADWSMASGVFVKFYGRYV